METEIRTMQTEVLRRLTQEAQAFIDKTKEPSPGTNFFKEYCKLRNRIFSARSKNFISPEECRALLVKIETERTARPERLKYKPDNS